MFSRLLPRHAGFFDYFEQHAALTAEACRQFRDLLDANGDLAEAAAHIKKLEHDTDTITHTCIDALHKTFITPIDRGHIHALIKRIDDIIDSVDAAASRILLYEIAEIRSEARELAAVLVQCAGEIEGAVKGLRHLGNADAINRHCIAIYGFENAADAILRRALVRLFKETDAILVIKWKEIFERMEKATDRCEQVANIIQGIVIEAS
ncbi:DUF47 domain-containing protein [bacterium]|nr:DUF47 domain-containing protein [bacterium]